MPGNSKIAGFPRPQPAGVPATLFYEDPYVVKSHLRLEET
jgi:hypothetical protein